MRSPRRLLWGALLAALVAVGLGVPAAQAVTVPKVTGLTANGSSLITAKLGVRWTRVSGASYQVRWAASTAALPKAKVYATTRTSALSPTLSNVCITWYAQVRAKKSGKFGAWSAAKGLRFSGTSSVPAAKAITTGQTSTTAAQVRWIKTPGAVGYRAHYSPAPFGNWPGYYPYTSTTSATSSGLSIPLPAVGPGDRFMNGAYGNPVFGQLETKRCGGTYTKSPFFAAFPKAPAPGDETTGSKLRYGTYNVELAPQSGDPKIVVIAASIVYANLDVIALQEANSGTAQALKNQLNSAEGQSDWEYYGLSQQFVMWRTSKWTSVSTQDIGKLVDGTIGVESDAAKTPLPSPGVHLTPAIADPTRKDIFVASVHLEDRRKFDTDATNAQQKQDAHDAVVSLLAAIALANPGPDELPTLVAGDLKGQFGGGGAPVTTGYCDESSTPACTGEGQPTFIRAGYLDARAAVIKVGVQYGSVNGHAHPQVAAASGVGSRADYIVVHGFTGINQFVNVANTSSTDSPSDHNLLYAELFVPFVAGP